MSFKTFLPAIGDGPTEPVDTKRGLTFLPFVLADWQVAGQGEPTGVAADLFALMRDDPGQQRPTVAWHDKLALAAQGHAEDMSRRGYFSHETPDGIWPNKMARNAGYRLPESYPDDKNYIESIAGGYPTPQAAWQAWMNSPSHSTHLLGLSDFYATQTMVGIGYYHMPESTYQHYYCICSAPPEVIT